MDRVHETDRKFLLAEVFLTALLLLFGVSVVLRYLAPSETPPFDTVVYSTAYSVASQGLNPYDTALLAPLQDPWYPPGYGPCPFLNPPLLLSIFGPVLRLEISEVGWWWRVMSVVASLAGAFLLMGTLSARRVALATAVTLCNVPLWAALHWGQFGGFLLLAIAMCWKGLKSRSPFLLGFGLTLLACKPLTFYLFLLVVAFEMVYRFSLRKILLSVAIPVSGFLLAAVQFPVATKGWWKSGFGSQVGSDHSVFLFNTDTLGSLISYAVGYEKPSPAILSVVVLLSIVFTLYFCIRRKEQSERLLSLIIPISAIVTPYGWLHDRVVLAPLLLTYWGALDARGRTVLLLALIGLQSAAASVLGATGNLGSVWWYSWVVLLVLIVLRKSVLVPTSPTSSLSK